METILNQCRMRKIKIIAAKDSFDRSIGIFPELYPITALESTPHLGGN